MAERRIGLTVRIKRYLKKKKNYITSSVLYDKILEHNNIKTINFKFYVIEKYKTHQHTKYEIIGILRVLIISRNTYNV